MNAENRHSVKSDLGFLLGLTWSGRVSLVYYPLRRLFLAPAPMEERCIMGSPVGPEVHCPRRAVGDGLWCKRHGPGDPGREWGWYE
jgi:hypothetical protein